MAEKPFRNRTTSSDFVEEEIVPSPPVKDTIEPVVKPELKPEPKKVVWPKKYICRTKCWVSSKCEMFYPGQVVDFYEGEVVPSHFAPL